MNFITKIISIQKIDFQKLIYLIDIILQQKMKNFS